MNGFGGGTNNVNDQAGMGKHRDVATVNSMGGCIHTLRHETFQLRVNGAVVVGHDVPTRFRLPGDARGVPAEEVGSRRIVSRPNKLLLLLREVSGEASDTFRTQPDAPI